MTREEAIKMLRHCGAEDYCDDGIHGTCKGCNRRTALDMAIEALQTDIVRCEDCKYIGKVGDVSICRIHEISTRADDYCSRGERSEE